MNKADNKNYESDVENIDNLKDDEKITLDNWKPSKRENSIIQSEWRKNQIGVNYNQEPSYDDLSKIKYYLKKNKPDFEIMKTFGINAQTLIAIKKNRYTPDESLELDDLDKFYREIKRLENQIKNIKHNFGYITHLLNIKEDDIKAFYKQEKEKKKKEKKKEKSIKDELC